MLMLPTNFTDHLKPTLINRFIKVPDWNVIPVDELRRDHGQLFSNFTSEPGDHQPVEDLTQLPLLDDQGREIPIYDEDGFRVLRRHPIAPKRLGCFLDLTKVPDLFYPSNDNINNNLRPRIPIYLYPMSFTKTMGNMQAEGVLHSFHRRIAALNDVVGRDADEAPASPAVQALRCQAYNVLSHRVRERAKFHSVQLGRITASLAGSGSYDKKVTKKWEQRRDRCVDALPHHRFDSKIDGRSPPQAMRFENVYKLNLARMKPEYRNGRFVLLRIYTLTSVKLICIGLQLYLQSNYHPAPPFLETSISHGSPKNCYGAA